ncbi:hypothetical protein CW735_02185 [Alteromonas sp. MB-3u-76]|nr:hypothetical protein CW735_02185 [Alteromonas sp. MB-3u-76]
MFKTRLSGTIIYSVFFANCSDIADNASFVPNNCSFIRNMGIWSRELCIFIYKNPFNMHSLRIQDPFRTTLVQKKQTFTPAHKG